MTKKKKKEEGYKGYKLLKAMPSTQLVSLTFVYDKIPFFGILCQSSFRSQFLVFILLGVSLCRINLDNCVLLVSCVDLLKTKFTISLSELRENHCFLLLDEYLLFQLKFSSVEPLSLSLTNHFAHQA